MTDPVVADLAARWRRARRSALRPLVAGGDTLDDDALAAAALDRDPDQALRQVFDVSLRLGGSFRGFYRVDLPLADLAALLPRLGVPCAARAWLPVADQPAYRAERAPCDAPARHPRACALWREAIEGLVLGLSGACRHARHRSGGGDEPVCVDVLYVHPDSPLRFGPIPASVRDGLGAVQRLAGTLDPASRVEFLGVSEGVLFYRVERAGPPGDGVRVNAAVEQGVRRRFPSLSPREVSSRPVLAAAT